MAIMNENRRRITSPGSVSEAATGSTAWTESSGQQADSYARISESMEKQLRMEQELLAAERNRQLAIDKMRTQQEALGRDSENVKAAFDGMGKSSSAFVEGTSAGVKNLFGTVIKSELTSTTNLWDVFCNSLAKSFANSTAKMASSWIKNVIGSIFGTSGAGGDIGLPFFSAEIFHSGGVAGRGETVRMVDPLLFAGAPRLHSGLASDEFPAILQRGEAVIPRGQNAGSASELNVEVRIDNQSAMPLRLEQGPTTRELDKYVINVVARDIDEYGVLGRMIQGQKRS